MESDSQLLHDQPPCLGPAAEASRRELSFAYVPGILVHIASFMRNNDVACSLRLINKVAAEALGDRNTIHLSQPVLEVAFAARWSPPAAMRPLTVSKRQKLLKLTAASGSLDNLRIAIQAEGMPPFHAVSEAAAAAGHVHLVQWLRQEGWTQNEGLLMVVAVSNGHVRFLEELIEEQLPYLRICADLLNAVAGGCDLRTLQRFFAARQMMHPRINPSRFEKARLVKTAAGSRTADWREKVEWLEAQGGGSRSDYACAAAVSCPDAVARLDWLLQRGYPVGMGCIRNASESGNTAAVQYLLEDAGLQCDAASLKAAVSAASRNGHLSVLQLLHRKTGLVPIRESIPCFARHAATNGHLAVVSWLADTFGFEAIRLDDQLFYDAAVSGSVELMAWLHEQQCPWWRGIEGAAAGGSMEALEWLVERGCPMPVDGAPYLAATANGDLVTLRSLRQLGFLWGPPGELFTQCLDSECRLGPPSPDHDTGEPHHCLRVVRWLLAEGCPVDWDDAIEWCREWRDPYVLKFMLHEAAWHEA